MFFACRRAVTARRAEPQGNSTKPRDVRTPRQAAKLPRSLSLQWGSFNGAAKPKNVFLPTTRNYLGGEMFFACRRAVTARRAEPQENPAKLRDVKAPRQAAKPPRSPYLQWGSFNGAAKPKNIPPPHATMCVPHYPCNLVTSFFQIKKAFPFS